MSSGSSGSSVAVPEPSFSMMFCLMRRILLWVCFGRARVAKEVLTRTVVQCVIHTMRFRPHRMIPAPRSFFMCQFNIIA